MKTPAKLAEKTPTASAVDPGVIKQLLQEEIDKLNKEREFLINKGHFENANNVWNQIKGIQTFWLRLHQEGIAL